MIQGIGFAANRNDLTINSNFLPTSQPAFEKDFREVLTKFRQNPAPPVINGGVSRDNILSSISQARVTTAASFNAIPAGALREQFNIQNHYAIPPEEVKSLLIKLEEEISNADFSDLSKKEIYEWIENKFIEAFGEDFMMGFNLFLIIPSSGMFNNPNRVMSNYEYIDIGHAFNELVSNSIGFGEMQKVNRERLYGNKSDMEVIDAIIAKHPDRLTNRCLALITAEMKSVGINDNIGFGMYVEKLLEKSGSSTMSGWSDYEETWNSLLNKPANVQQMAFSHNKAMEDEPKNPHVLRVRDILIKLGAELGPNGYFLDPDGNPFIELNVEYGSLDSDDLFDEFHNDLEQHDEKLRDSRESPEKNRYSREASDVYDSTSDNYL
jgi:hypothetical protein